MTRILILGASGFIGGALYKELCHYYDTYGTYHTGRIYSENRHFIHYDMEQQDVYNLLLELRPTIIISALRGPFEAQVEAHGQIAAYCRTNRTRIIFLSSANVFDAFSNFPSYEYDKTLSESPYGKLKIRLENMFMKLPERQHLIARLPMVFGSQSPRIKELKYHLENKQAYEVFPNLVMNVTNDNILSRQLHYMINRKRKGIYHLGSTDLIHHNEFIKECCAALGVESPFFKNVYTSNFDRFLAVLPKYQHLPKHLRFTHREVIEELR
ncbi:sugar nucleotide-binding protein [Robertkochia sediminum]|uniref:sugar nucleotide-binding protein n=1 Tax=Robertkochia sediminum TaxID=2785326 RepID=UPI001931EAD2|nr:sugar nucleotide-binding protein [Robertkochia sediminum]MBL7474131.1 sugar nucleotide-binding protein [Robertkochia sediminum]